MRYAGTDRAVYERDRWFLIRQKRKFHYRSSWQGIKT